MENLEKFIELLQDKYKFTIKYKDSSTFMKILAKILFFVPNFATHFTTTIGKTIYVPNKKYLNNEWDMSLIAHECRHIYDSNNDFLFKFKYILPQILSLLFFGLCFVSLWFLIPAFLMLAPLPAYWRKQIEFKGYTTSLFVDNLLLKNKNFPLEKRFKLLKEKSEYINSHFTSSSYYFMWIFGVQNQLNYVVELILQEKLEEKDEFYKFIKNAFEKSC